MITDAEPASFVDPAGALSALGFCGGEIVQLLEQQRNTTWEARTSAGSRIILRRYRHDRGLDEVHYELDVVQRLDLVGWPVPVPLAPALEFDGAVWCVAKFLEGAPLNRGPEQQRLLGRLIARLQQDLASLGISQQRVGWSRADQVFDASPSPQETFRSFAARSPDEARILVECSERAEQQLIELQSQSCPSVLVHGDVTTWNVHFVDDKLTGLLDFEMAHLDLGVAEFAHTWRGRYEDFIEGFEEVSPLTEQEQELIAPVRWASLIGNAHRDLLTQEDPDLGWTMRQLQRRSHRMRF